MFKMKKGDNIKYVDQPWQVKALKDSGWSNEDAKIKASKEKKSSVKNADSKGSN